MARHHRRPRERPASAKAENATTPASSWGRVAEWYDQSVGDEGGEYHRAVVHPGVLRLLGGADDLGGLRVLDVACGQGVLCRLLHAKGATAVGTDAAAPLLAAARQRGPAEIDYRLADARELASADWLDAGGFDAATCVLAAQNLNPIRPAFDGVARALAPGGRFVLVTMHPAFRVPQASAWGWDDTGDKTVQYRRVDHYLLPRKVPIQTHPGVDGDDSYTWHFHRPMSAYVKALRQAGLLVDAMEEWAGHKESEPGPRAAAENTARKEFPMFLAIRAVKVTLPDPPATS